MTDEVDTYVEPIEVGSEVVEEPVAPTSYDWHVEAQIVGGASIRFTVPGGTDENVIPLDFATEVPMSIWGMKVPLSGFALTGKYRDEFRVVYAVNGKAVMIIFSVNRWHSS